MYGLDHWEELEGSINDVLERIYTDYFEGIRDTDEDIAARVSWPVVVWEHKRQELPEDKQMADNILKELYERLNDQYQEDSYIEPTDNEKTYALMLVKCVIASYEPWYCDRTGRKMTITKEMASCLTRLDFVPDEETT